MYVLESLVNVVEDALVERMRLGVWELWGPG